LERERSNYEESPPNQITNPYENICTTNENAHTMANENIFTSANQKQHLFEHQMEAQNGATRNCGMPDGTQRQYRGSWYTDGAKIELS
jgi:hypothetical protein